MILDPTRIDPDVFVSKGRLLGDFSGERIFLETIRHTTHNYRPFRNASRAHNAFYYFPNYEDAMKTFLDYPDKLVAFVENELQLLEKNEIGSEYWMDVTGDFLDIGTYLEGDPECFGNMYMGNPKRTFVTILLKLDVPWTTHVDYLVYYAARVLRFVDWLESKEVRTRIIAYSSTEIEHIEIKLKDYYEPVSLSSIAVVCNPDFYRRAIFQVREQSNRWDASYGSTYEQDKLFMSQFHTLAENEESILLFMDRSSYENNREATTQAFDSAEDYMIRMLADEENKGALII